MAKTPSKAKTNTATTKPHLVLVSSDKAVEDKKAESDLVGFFKSFEEAIRKEIEAILSL